VVRQYERELEEFMREDLREAVLNGAINPVIREQVVAVLHSEEYDTRIRKVAKDEARQLFRRLSVAILVLAALSVGGLVIFRFFVPPVSALDPHLMDPVEVDGFQTEMPHGDDAESTHSIGGLSELARTSHVER